MLKDQNLSRIRSSDYLIVQTPLEWVEWGGTIHSTATFFVQTILNDRYIHRREL